MRTDVVALFNHLDKQLELPLRHAGVLGHVGPVDHGLDRVELVHDIDKEEVRSVAANRPDSS